MRKILLLVACFSFLLLNFSLAQFQISGKVIDSTTGEPLIGANVFIPELNRGTTTDFEGAFKINVSKSKVRVKVSYVGYKTIDTVIAVDKESVINFRLKPDVIELGKVEVTGSVKQDNISLKSFIATKQMSMGIFDGLSYEQIKLTTASTSSDLMTKIVGVSVKQGKFVNVRGVEERYSIATLNGSFLPSPEPDKKAFTFDLIPSGLVQSIKVVKTFSPDLPGNFSGGFIDIKTIEFSDSMINSTDLSVSTIPDVTFKKFFVYGMDRLNLFGTSAKQINGLPSDFPEDITKVPVEERNVYARSIKNLWSKNSFYNLPNFKTSFFELWKIDF